MTSTAAIASRHEIVVAAPPERAFEVFTARMGTWWNLSDHHIGEAPAVDAVMEPEPGGFWGEIAADGTRCPWGSVLAWEPPTRVLLAWNLDTRFAYDPDTQTEVEVTFTPDGSGGTLVVLEHRLDGYGDKAAEMQVVFDQPNAWSALLAEFAKAA